MLLKSIFITCSLSVSPKWDSGPFPTSSSPLGRWPEWLFLTCKGVLLTQALAPLGNLCPREGLWGTPHPGSGAAFQEGCGYIPLPGTTSRLKLAPGICCCNGLLRLARFSLNRPVTLI